MAVRLTDKEIGDLLGEPKPLPEGHWAKLKLRPKRGHEEGQLDVTGGTGNQFRLILRRNNLNPLDFSVIVAFLPRQTNQVFRLRRYNGKHGEHTNRIEGRKIDGFHVHSATERYQDLGADEDAYAEPTDAYADFPGALAFALKDSSFQATTDGQHQLFGEA
jgi:hypothetical protein